MKKRVKILTTILMAIVVLITSLNVTFAGEAGLIKTIGEGSNVETGSIQNFGKAAVSIARVVGVIVAVVVLLVLGIKYMIGSAEERAEYKKTMIPYIVGAILIFASTTIVGIVYDLASSLNNGAVA